jgi:hypothetical protein
MAYSATKTVTKITADNYIIDVEETDAAVGSSTQISPQSDARLPKAGRIFRVSSVKVSGSATTLAPALSAEDSFTSEKLAVKVTAAASPIDESISGGLPYASDDGSLYHTAGVDAGSDNVVNTRYLIKTDWQ